MSSVCDYQIQPSPHALQTTSCVLIIAASVASMFVMETKTAWMALMRKIVVRIWKIIHVLAIFLDLWSNIVYLMQLV